ncbi:MAG: sensor histidine kinase [Ginsengibacter sp.]
MNSGFNINIAFVLAVREVMQSLFAFYFICYYAIPLLLLPGKYVQGVIALLIPFILAPLINYLIFIILNPILLIDKVSSEYVERGLFVENFNSLFRIQPMIISFMPLVLRTMPAFVMKLLVSTVRYFYNSKRQQEREYELERSNFKLEINFLKSQMNPHFFFNTLNNIYSYVYLKDEKALDLISNLSEIMQYTLYATRDSLVPLEQEVRFLEHYIGLEKSRFNENNGAIQFDFHYRNMEGFMVTPLLLFPFIENAFKYGPGHNKKTGWLYASAEMKNGSLYFFVENNKPEPHYRPSPKDKVFIKDQPAIGGIGVSSTVRRLSLLYKDKHELTINDNPNVYSVSLKLKCRQDEPKVAMPYS